MVIIDRINFKMSVPRTAANWESRGMVDTSTWFG